MTTVTEAAIATEDTIPTKTLIMMVGLPRSGKSTKAKELAFPVVNPDSIRLALHGQPFIGLAEPFVWAIAKTMVRALFLSGHDNVILDATNTSKKRRDEWKSKTWKREFVICATPVDECKMRAVQTGREDLLPVIDRMSAEYEEPTPDEG